MVVGRELWGSLVQPLVQSGPMLHHVSQKSVLITTVFLILCCSPSFLLLSHIFPAGPLTKMLLERCSVVGNAGNLSTLPMLPATWAGRSGNGCRREETAITQVGQGGVNGLLVPGSKLLTAWPPAMEFGLLSPIVKSERWITHSVLCSNLFSSHSGELGLVNDTCKSPIWDQSCCLCRWYCKVWVWDFRWVSLQNYFKAAVLSSLHTFSLQLSQLLPPRGMRQVVFITLCSSLS